MNDVERLMNNIGSHIHYRQFHEATTEGHTQTPRRAAPLKETEPEADRNHPLYDPEGAQYESHPIDASAMPPAPQMTWLAAEPRSWDQDRRRTAPSAGFNRYAASAEPVDAPEPQSRLLKDIFARLERVGRRDAGRVQ